MPYYTSDPREPYHITGFQRERDDTLLISRYGATFQAMVTRRWEIAKKVGVTFSREILEEDLWNQFCDLIEEALGETLEEPYGE